MYFAKAGVDNTVETLKIALAFLSCSPATTAYLNLRPLSNNRQTLNSYFNRLPLRYLRVYDTTQIPPRAAPSLFIVSGKVLSN